MAVPEELGRAQFIGRQAELAALRSALNRAAHGDAVAVLIDADAGVGKTRLVQRLLSEVRPAMLTFTGQCVAVADGELPFAAVAGVLRGLARELDADELNMVLGRARLELGWLAPELAPSDAPPPDSALGQARLFEQLYGVLARLASIRPLVAVFEDIHWADQSTRDFLRFLVRNLQTERIALIATYRTDDVHRAHPLRPVLAELEREPKVRRIRLAPFSHADFADHVRSLTGHAPDAALLDRLYARSEGNAFYTEELVAADDDTLPASLRDVLLVRLERLSGLAQQVVQVAAVAGRRVDHQLLAATVELPVTDLAAAVREAVAAHVLVPIGGERAYEFRHALLREAAYLDLLPGEREALHRALAQALQAQPEPTSGRATAAAELAHHWHAANAVDVALPASVRAGHEAMRVFAFAEAAMSVELGDSLTLGTLGPPSRSSLMRAGSSDLVRPTRDQHGTIGARCLGSARLYPCLYLDRKAQPARVSTTPPWAYDGRPHCLYRSISFRITRTLEPRLPEVPVNLRRLSTRSQMGNGHTTTAMTRRSMRPAMAAASLGESAVEMFVALLTWGTSSSSSPSLILTTTVFGIGFQPLLQSRICWTTHPLIRTAGYEEANT